jgi:hypothetical protein
VNRIFLVIGLLAMSLPLAAEPIDGILVDKTCAAGIQKRGYAAAERHTRKCALMPKCQASGFGVVTEDGKFLKFDAAGDEKALEALKETTEEEGLVVLLEGKIEGDTVAVKSLRIF